MSPTIQRVFALRASTSRGCSLKWTFERLRRWGLHPQQHEDVRRDDGGALVVHDCGNQTQVQFLLEPAQPYVLLRVVAPEAACTELATVAAADV